MLNWLRGFNIFCFLDNCNYHVPPTRYEFLVGAGALEHLQVNTPSELDASLSSNSHWMFGHISYDLKNQLHELSKRNEEKIGFPLFQFYVPEVVLFLKGEELFIKAEEPALIYKEIEDQQLVEGEQIQQVKIQAQFSREEYIEKIRGLQKHILRGDCYEINFCQEFFAPQTDIDPFFVFEKLTEVSPNPFTAFYRLDDKYLMSASPERFLFREKGVVLSQPIKGTIKRDLSDPSRDEELKKELFSSGKDRAENVMIVDLVRNDLSKFCSDGSVKVDELFGIYSYPQVHQMISTISGKLDGEVPFSKIIDSCFPMGSMTGAPKHRVMQLIDEFEDNPRGIFSGSVGYFDPEGNFDLNVVIRSLMYNQTSGYLSYRVGSGITFYSDAELEWEECLLKAEAIKKVLAGASTMK